MKGAKSSISGNRIGLLSFPYFPDCNTCKEVLNMHTKCMVKYFACIALNIYIYTRNLFNAIVRTLGASETAIFFLAFSYDLHLFNMEAVYQ
jgi:hypothetical protein